MRYSAILFALLFFIGCDPPGRPQRPAPPLPPAPAVDDRPDVVPPANEDPTVDVRNLAEYGYCPKCGAKGVSRERKINGNDTCANGHVYPTKHAVYQETHFTTGLDKVTQFTPSDRQPPPQFGNFGYEPNPQATKEFLRSLPKPDIRSAAPHLFDPKARVKQINMQQPGSPRGPPLSARQPVLLYKALYDVCPGWVVGAQGIGDCVSWGYAHACDIALAVDCATGKSGNWKPAATEAIYGGSRVEGRGKPEGTGGWGDGSYGAAASKWLNHYGGVVYRDPFTELGYDLTRYDKNRAKSWGNYGCGGQGDRGRLDAVAKARPVGQVALVRTFDEAAAAIESGYPVPVCSGRGFTHTRDKDGFASPSGGWSHCMCFTAVRYEPRPGLLCQNSWGPNWISGPVWPDDQPAGSFWVDASVATGMLKGEDSFAIANVTGFPLRELQHELGW